MCTEFEIGINFHSEFWRHCSIALEFFLYVISLSSVLWNVTIKLLLRAYFHPSYWALWAFPIWKIMSFSSEKVSLTISLMIFIFPLYFLSAIPVICMFYLLYFLFRHDIFTLHCAWYPPVPNPFILLSLENKLLDFYQGKERGIGSTAESSRAALRIYLLLKQPRLVLLIWGPPSTSCPEVLNVSSYGPLTFATTSLGLGFLGSSSLL